MNEETSLFDYYYLEDKYFSQESQDYLDGSKLITFVDNASIDYCSTGA